MAITVSLCMIVRNEEDVLARCLDSVKDLVEEIVVVDTGSEDRTKEIAAAYTAEIYDFKWVDDFAAARNYAFSRASMEYQMWLDADDVILLEDREKFLTLKETCGHDADMVMLPYHAAFDETGTPVMTYFRERLMRRESGFTWDGAVHEAIAPRGVIVYGEAAVSHKKLHPSDPDRNLRIYEEMLKLGEITDPRHQFYYGRELYYHERYEEAIEVLEKFLEDGKGWVENNISACLDLSRCYERLQKEESALEALFRSFRYENPRPEICCAIGSWFLEKGQYFQAIYWYRCAMDQQTDEKSGGFVHPDCHDFIPALQLCVCYDRTGQYKLALFYHEMAKRQKPSHPSVLYNEQYFQEKGIL